MSRRVRSTLCSIAEKNEKKVVLQNDCSTAFSFADILTQERQASIRTPEYEESECRAQRGTHFL